MEYQKKQKNKLLDNTSDQLSKFRAKNWVEINVTHVEHITKIVKLNLKLQWWSQGYKIIVMHVYF